MAVFPYSSRVHIPQSVKPRTSLSRVVGDLGGTLLEVIAGDPGRVSNIGGVAIYDAVDDDPIPGKAVVLGVGVHDAVHINQLLFELGRQGAAALIVRAPVDETPDLVRAVGKSGVVLLALTKGASWSQLAAMLRNVLGENDVGDEAASTLGGSPSGDLFALANAIAALVDAPVTIEDRSFNVLAYSAGQNVADASRVETILGRRVPKRVTKVLESTGMIAALYKTKGEIYSQPETLDFEEDVMLRVAVAVRAGDEILGSIWAAVPERLNEERTQAFLDSAKLVALHMLRLRAGADVRSRLRTDLVSTALEGGPSAPEALGRLGLFGHAVTVVALSLLPHDFDSEDPVSESRVIAERQRLADALAVHLGAVAPRSAVALIGDVTYGLLPMAAYAGDGEHRAKRIMAGFFGRLGSKVPVVAGVGVIAKDSSHLIQSRLGADRSLRVMLDRAVPGAVAAISEVQIGALILELGDMVLARGDQISGPIARLRDYDTEHNGRLLETLECWLNAFGNGAEAAEAAFVHTNTFRYRLRRVAEVGQIDLTSPDDRFEAMVQLRLLARTDATD